MKRVLLVATQYEQPYRVLRCLAASQAEVFVLGCRAARKMRRSRFCKRFIAAQDEAYGDGFVSQVNRLVEIHGIDEIFPSDAFATRALIAHQARIKGETYPLPDNVGVFDMLNDKGAFAALCDQLGVRHPFTRVYARREDVDLMQWSGPVVVKPVNDSGSAGVKVVRDFRLPPVTYAPVLVQQFLGGTDECVSLFCRDGRIVASVMYRQIASAYVFFHDEDVARLVHPILDRTRYTGCICFDIRRDTAGAPWVIECNPRFWFNMDFALLAGLNWTQVHRGGGSGRQSVRDQVIPRLGRLFGRMKQDGVRVLFSDPYVRYLVADPLGAGLQTTQELLRAMAKKCAQKAADSVVRVKSRFRAKKPL